MSHFLRPKEYAAALGKSPAVLYSSIKAGTILGVVKLGARASGVKNYEAELQSKAILAGLSKDQRIELVALLEQARIDALDEAEVCEKALGFIRGTASANAKKAAA